MDNYIKNYNEELIKRSFDKFEFKLYDLKNMLSLNIIEDEDEDEDEVKGEIYVDIKKYAAFTQAKYWLEVLVYDLKCVHTAMIYIDTTSLHYSVIEREKRNDHPLYRKDICVDHDYYMFIDLGLDKIFSAIDKVSQLVNCTFELDLEENILGSNGVSLYNVKKKLKNSYPDVFALLTQLTDFKTYNDLKKIRNAIIHHYNPFHFKEYTDCNIKGDHITLQNRALHLDKLYGLDDFDMKNPIWVCSSIKHLYGNFETILPLILSQLNNYFNINMYIYKNE